MKRILSLLLVILMLLIPFTSYAAFSIKISSDFLDAELGDLLLLGAAALFFDLDTEVNLKYRAQTGSPMATISLYYIAGESKGNPDTIIADKKGRGWGALAQGKVPPGLAKKWGLDRNLFSKDDKEIETGLTIHFLSSYYGVRQKDITKWMDKGLTLQDIAICINLAKKVKVAPHKVVNLRIKGESWSDISDKYEVSVLELKNPIKPKKKYDKPLPIQKGKK